mgnify:CR=1 FL=1
MPRKGFIIDVDQATADCDVKQVIAALGGDLSQASEKGDELRLPCFLACGHSDASGRRVLAVQTGSRGKLWACHNYDCPVKGGNLAKLIDLTTPGASLDGKPSGDRFKQVARTLKAIIGGEAPAVAQDNCRAAVVCATESTRPVNVPLHDNENERIRAIADLHEQLTLDRETLSPAASQYVARRPYLTAELAVQRKLGYLTSSSRGVLRGKFVYAVNNRNGNVVAYIGRNLNYEAEHSQWLASGKQGDEPTKYHIPKNFHRGVELYGQEYITPETIGVTLCEIGLPVVEGCGDVLNLAATLRTRAVGLLSNRMTDWQRETIVDMANAVAGGVVTLLYDNDEPGNEGAAADAAELAKYVRVQRAWSLDTHPDLAGMQAEQLTPELGARLREGVARRGR